TVRPVAYAVLGLALSTGCASGLTTELKRDITFKVQDRRVALVDCYTRALAFNPTLKADMLVAFEIREETKRFRSVRLKQGAGISPDLERCVIEELRDIQLDKAPDVRVEATLPVDFTPLAGGDSGNGFSSFGGDDDDDAFDDDEDLK
ncbi:MAG: hypothetical protein AAGK78_10340, partial [Planctomycetota bacterium]